MELEDIIENKPELWVITFKDQLVFHETEEYFKRYTLFLSNPYSKTIPRLRTEIQT